jgi:hypothetical protein
MRAMISLMVVRCVQRACRTYDSGHAGVARVHLGGPQCLLPDPVEVVDGAGWPSSAPGTAARLSRLCEPFQVISKLGQNRHQ